MDWILLPILLWLVGYNVILVAAMWFLFATARFQVWLATCRSRLHSCVCELSTWLVCSQYLKRGSLTLGITSLYTMCSAIVVSRDKATPTQSITNRPEKCFIPICSVWRVGESERLQAGRTEPRHGGKEEGVAEDKRSGVHIYCI